MGPHGDWGCAGVRRHASSFTVEGVVRSPSPRSSSLHYHTGRAMLDNSQIVLYRLRQYFHKILVPTLASLLSSHTQSFPRITLRKVEMGGESKEWWVMVNECTEALINRGAKDRGSHTGAGGGDGRRARLRHPAGQRFSEDPLSLATRAQVMHSDLSIEANNSVFLFLLT